MLANDSSVALSNVSILSNKGSRSNQVFISTPNEKRLSADAEVVDESAKSFRRINLVGLNRREGGSYGDCKEAARAVNRIA